MPPLNSATPAQAVNALLIFFKFMGELLKLGPSRHFALACKLLFANSVNPARYILECRDLGRELPSPQSRLLLQNISFALQPGEVLAVVGPSGAGKSTLLRLLNRLDEPTQGSVFFQGRDGREIPPLALRRSIGMVMQRAYLFPGTIAENVAFGPAQQGKVMPLDQIAELLAHVGLEGYAGRDALTLSGGEAQRVAITRALANEPEVLLLDEPTSVQNLLASLIRERKLTCVWVTHSAEQARTMAHRVLALRGGRIEAIGTPSEVLHA
jgi:putative ABC transport system ATP-binding protein